MNRNGSKWCWPVTRQRVYQRDGYRCMYCGRDLTFVPSKRRTLDHVVARLDGGGNDARNLVTACNTCNSKRGDIPLAQWATRETIERVRLAQWMPLPPAKGRRH